MAMRRSLGYAPAPCCRPIFVSPCSAATTIIRAMVRTRHLTCSSGTCWRRACRSASTRRPCRSRPSLLSATWSACLPCRCRAAETNIDWRAICPTASAATWRRSHLTSSTYRHPISWVMARSPGHAGATSGWWHLCIPGSRPTSATMAPASSSPSSSGSSNASTTGSIGSSYPVTAWDSCSAAGA